MWTSILSYVYSSPFLLFLSMFSAIGGSWALRGIFDDDSERGCFLNLYGLITVIASVLGVLLLVVSIILSSLVCHGYYFLYAILALLIAFVFGFFSIIILSKKEEIYVFLIYCFTLLLFYIGGIGLWRYIIEIVQQYNKLT